MSGQPAMRLTDVTKVFPVRGSGSRAQHVAVDSVSFELAAGRCLGIVGESGSGKSTLARMMVGLETATSGRIEIAGHDRAVRVRSASARRQWARRIQMVFQDPYTSLDRRQNGVASLTEVLDLHFDHSPARTKERIAELGEQVGLSEMALRRPPGQLSGGQRQRLAIARALAVEPDVLVLDESVSALDVSVQAQVLNYLADIRDQLGMTYVFVSHDLGVVRQIADDVLVLQHGKVVEHGLVGEVLDNPAQDYTRLLKASVPGPGWTPPAVELRL